MRCRFCVVLFLLLLAGGSFVPAMPDSASAQGEPCVDDSGVEGVTGADGRCEVVEGGSDVTNTGVSSGTDILAGNTIHIPITSVVPIRICNNAMGTGVVAVPVDVLSPDSCVNVAGAVSGNTYTSDEFGYSLAWDETWAPVEGSSGAGYDTLHLVTEGADFFLEAYVAHGGDPDACVADRLGAFQASTAYSDLAVIEQSPAAADGGDPAVASMTVTLTAAAPDGTPLHLAATVICQTLVPGAAVIIATFVAPVDAFEALAPAVDTLLGNVALPPSAAPLDLQTFLPEVQADIDAFWTAAFAADGLTYEPPGVVSFDGPVATGCGSTEPFAVGPFYCMLDSTIYYDVPLMAQEIVPMGTLVVAFTAAHETGHHLEHLLGITKCQDAECATGIPSAYYELLADCFAGIWVRSAADRGLDATGDLEETIVALASFFGDKGAIADDTMGDPMTAHGPGSQRTWWFLKGYFEGIDGCLSADGGALEATPAA